MITPASKESYSQNEDAYSHNNTLLRNIYVSRGQLTPAFSPTHTRYTLSLSYEADSLSLIAEADDLRANVEGNIHQTALSVGYNIFNFLVVAENQIDRKIYTVSVNRAAKTASETSSSKRPKQTSKKIKPYAYYPLHGDILDYSGNKHHLIAPRAQPAFAVGYEGKKALLGGYYLHNYGLNTPFNIDSSWQSFVIMFRVKLDDRQPWYPNIFDKNHATRSDIGYTGYGFNFQAVDEKWGWGYSEEPDFYLYTKMDTSWHTIACVRRTSDGAHMLFKDGKLINAVYIFKEFPFTAEPLKIGVCYHWASDRYFNGFLENFTIFKEELTDKQIIEEMSKL